ncbi:MAG: hypothetical protein AAF826_07920, partial [Pseudomonadota bacterium]
MVLISGFPAFSDNECGVAAPGATVNCSAGTYSNGISYNAVQGLTLNLNDPGIDLTTQGVFLQTNSTTGDITINGTQFGSILPTTTNTVFGKGLYAFVGTATSTSNSLVTLSDGTIVTVNNGQAGLETENRGLGSGTVTMDGGTISTTGVNSDGLSSQVFNASNASVVSSIMSGGVINTTGNNSDGV